MLQKFLILITIFSSYFNFDCSQSNIEFESMFQNELQNQTIDNLWKRNKIIGKGGFGQVKEIDWNQNNKIFKIALKQMVIPDDVTEELVTMQVEPLQKEVDNLVRFSDSHPDLFPIFYGCSINYHDVLGPVDFFIFQEKLFADMDKKKSEFMNKKTLLERIKIYGQLFESLEIMHEQGYVHSDIKPANIMTTDSEFNKLKLIDFGATDLIGEDIAAGSPAYNAPEKINFKYMNSNNEEIEIDTLTGAQDVWALAVSIMSIESRGTFIFSGIDKNCFTRDFSTECYNHFLNNYGEVVNKVFNSNSYPNFTKFLKKLVLINPELRPTSGKAKKKLFEFVANDDNLKDISLTSIPKLHKVFKPKGNDEDLIKFLEKSFDRNQLDEMRNEDIKQVNGNYIIGNNENLLKKNRRVFNKLNPLGNNPSNNFRIRKFKEPENKNASNVKLGQKTLADLSEIVKNQKLNNNIFSPKKVQLKKKLVPLPVNKTPSNQLQEKITNKYGYNENLVVLDQKNNAANIDLNKEDYNPLKYKKQNSSTFASNNYIRPENKNVLSSNDQKNIINYYKPNNNILKKPIAFLSSDENKMKVNRNDIRELIIKNQKSREMPPVIKMENINFLKNQNSLKRII